VKGCAATASAANDDITTGDTATDDAAIHDEMTEHAATDSAPCHRVPVSGTRAERYQVVVHVELATLACAGAGGRSELEDGTRVSAETSRRLACDASIVRVQRGYDSAILDVGRRTRTIPPALRRALEVRDAGCRFPGCGLRFCDAHHVVHWADGGATALSNTVLLCRYHHRLVHEGGFRVELPPGCRPNFYDPRGQPLPDRSPIMRAGEHAAEALVRQNRRCGIVPDFRTGAARYRREADVPWHMIVRAIDALEISGDGGGRPW
ncbi:MAG: DUF222 domain-containing protein, partial [Longimicrobiales bacterium]